MYQKFFKKAYYRIRTELFWGMILCILVLLTAGVHANYRLWKEEGKDPSEDEKQMRIEVTYDDWHSELADPDRCLLCREEARRESASARDAMGLILLNNWTILNFQPRNSGLTGEEERSSNSGIRYGHTGDISWLSSSDPDRGMARISLTLPEQCRIDEEYIRKNLCQSCLDKVTASLRFWKGEQEEKEPVPLCILDFQTSEIYSVQDWYRGYFIRDYWIELEFDGCDISIKAYYLPIIALWSSKDTV